MVLKKKTISHTFGKHDKQSATGKTFKVYVVTSLRLKTLLLAPIQDLHSPAKTK
jgi:hypothetical protein